MKSFKTLALIAALSAGAFASTTFATGGKSGVEPLSIKTCNLDGSCQSPNGPSLDGLAQPSGVKQHGNIDTNGPSLDGLVGEAREVSPPVSIKVCNTDGTCSSPNGPSESGLADLQLGTVVIAIDMP